MQALRKTWKKVNKVDAARRAAHQVDVTITNTFRLVNYKK
jgi:hypothetical protein